MFGKLRFPDLCFPILEFQIGRGAFNGTNYYIFMFDTIRSPIKPYHGILKGRFVCILQPKPRNSTFVIESGGVLGTVRQTLAVILLRFYLTQFPACCLFLLYIVNDHCD